ncbi:MAG: hypothetical protein AMXMBFR53_02130 [Gemmatimonadota bacterium]
MLPSSRPALLRAALLLTASTAIAACVPGETRAQSAASRGSVGLVLSFDVGGQNIIGGALVSGVDVLAQARRAVGTVSVGIRAETSFGLVGGIAIGFGAAKGDLRHEDASVPLEVGYRNRTQRHWELMVGQSFGPGRETDVHLYLSEVSRDFEVDVVEKGVRYQQRDGQGLLRFGVGLERKLSPHFGVRGRIGTSRADFGGRVTNIEPRRLIDVMVGGVVHP